MLGQRHQAETAVGPSGAAAEFRFLVRTPPEAQGMPPKAESPSPDPRPCHFDRGLPPCHFDRAVASGEICGSGHSWERFPVRPGMTWGVLRSRLEMVGERLVMEGSGEECVWGRAPPRANSSRPSPTDRGLSGPGGALPHTHSSPLPSITNLSPTISSLSRSTTPVIPGLTGNLSHGYPLPQISPLATARSK